MTLADDSQHAVEVVLINRLEEVERVAQELDAFGRRFALPARVVFDASLALDEILTNVISYAYDDEREHQIVVRLGIGAGRLTVEVEDDGKAFDPLLLAAPDLTLPVEQRPVGGLGLSLVRQLMSELRYERRGGRNVLTLVRVIGDEGSETAADDLASAHHEVAGVEVVRVEGRLDARGSSALEHELLGRIAAGARRIAVDCTAVDYINSAGLRALLLAAKRLAARGGAIALAAPQGQVRSVVEMAGLEAVFAVCESVEEARAAVRRAVPSSQTA